MLQSPHDVETGACVASPSGRSRVVGSLGGRPHDAAAGRPEGTDRAGRGRRAVEQRVGERAGYQPSTLLRWRQRYVEAGVAGLLKDAPRPGRRKRIRPEKVEAIVNATRHPTPRDATHWSVRSL